MQGTGKIILQLVYHREQVDIEHADIMIDEQTAVYREVVAAECRHDVPYARCDFAAAVNGRGRIERSESGDFVDESVVLEPLLVDDIAALGGAGELAHSDCARSEKLIYIAVDRAVSAVRIALGRAARIGEIIDIFERRDILIYRESMVDIHVVLCAVRKRSVEMRSGGNGEHGDNRALFGGGVDIFDYSIPHEIGGRAVMRSGERCDGIYPICLSAREQVGDIAALSLALGLAAVCHKLSQKSDGHAAE